MKKQQVDLITAGITVVPIRERQHYKDRSKQIILSNWWTFF